MKILKFLGKLIFHKSFYRIKEYNKEAINNKAIILCPNHVSDADGPILWSSFNNITIMAKKECFKNKLLAYALNKLDIVSVDRGKKTGAALKSAIKILEKGKQNNMVYMLFPQGTISDINKNTINRVKQGAFYVADTSDLPIVPTFIEQPRLFRKSRIVYGNQIEVDIRNEKGIIDKNKLLELRKTWMEEIINLQDEAVKLENKPIRKLKLNYKHSNNNDG